jgi:hypothetical protein
MKSREVGLGSSFSFLAGIGLGAGLMALLDPGRGAARRSYIRGKTFHGLRVAGREGAKQFKRMQNELAGALAESKAKLLERNVPDEILIERVHAQLGHVVKNFGLLEIDARQGYVTVWGPTLRGERGKIIDRLQETRGVRNFYVQVEEHDNLDQVAGIHGQQTGQEQARRVS